MTVLCVWNSGRAHLGSPQLGVSPATAVGSWIHRHLKAQLGWTSKMSHALSWQLMLAISESSSSAADQNTCWSQVPGVPQRTRWKLQGVFWSSLRYCTVTSATFYWRVTKVGPDSRGRHIRPTTQQKEGLSICTNILKSHTPSSMELQSEVTSD